MDVRCLDTEGPRRAGIIDLSIDVRRTEGLAMLFITHDLAIMSPIATRTRQGR